MGNWQTVQAQIRRERVYSVLNGLREFSFHFETKDNDFYIALLLFVQCIWNSYLYQLFNTNVNMSRDSILRCTRLSICILALVC